MLATLYIPGNSPVHRLAPRAKILSLVCFGTAIFLIHDLTVVLLAGMAIGLLYKLAHLSVVQMVRQIRPVSWILLAIFAVQYFINGWEFAVLIVARFVALILAASLVTLTTGTSDLIDGIERSLWKFKRWLPVKRISLAISLCIRFIPTIQGIVSEVKDAQRARGISSNVFAIAVPVIIRTLQMADQISEAIYARSFEVETASGDVDQIAKR